MKNLIQKSIYFLIFFLPALEVFANEGGAGGDSGKGLFALAAGIGIGLAALGGSLGQGKAAAAALEGIARNPAAKGQLFVPMIIGLAFIESLVIYALIISFSLFGKL